MEKLNEPLRNGDDFCAIAGIEGRLAAAGLVLDIVYLNAEMVKDFDHGHGRVRIQVFGKAGDEERDFHERL